MKQEKSIESQLRQILPPMRPGFKKQLRGQLFKKAQKEFDADYSNVSILSLLFNSMRRYKLIYSGMAVVLTLVITTLSILPISPDKVLARALDNYESQEGIYHQKVLTSFTEFGPDNEILRPLVPDYLREIYADDLGNILSLNKNPVTDENISVFFEKIDQFGDVQIYETPQGADSWETLSDEAFKQRMRTFEGEKLYCLETVENDSYSSRVTITMAADDLSVYHLNNEIHSKDNIDRIEFDYNNLNALLQTGFMNKNAELIRWQIEMASEDGIDYSKINENGEDYYVFRIDVPGGIPGEDYQDGGSFYMLIYFNENYKIARYENWMEGVSVPAVRYDILADEYLPQTMAESIFDPDQFEGLEHYTNSYIYFPKNLNENGCYDWQINPLNEQDIEAKSPNGFIEWKNLISSTKSDMDSWEIPRTDQIVD